MKGAAALVQLHPRTQVSKQFYITFGQPRRYGWLRIESNLAQETVFLTYAINPTGSRNLEPGQATVAPE